MSINNNAALSQRDNTTLSLARSKQDAYPNIDASMSISNRGLSLPQRISFEKWLGIGIRLSSILSSSAWCLGDWLVYGESAFEGRYREAVERTALDYQTLRNYAWVVRKFPLSRRRDKLAFGHHAEVAALSEPEQDYWLGKAEELRWTVKELRCQVRASLRERREGVGGQEPGSRPANEITLDFGQRTVMLSVPISTEHMKACRRVAEECGLDMDKWASQAIVRALGEHAQL